MAKRRARLLISDEVQTSLLFRLTVHWVAFLSLTTLSLSTWIYFIDSPTASGEELTAAVLRVLVPFLVCSLVVVPVFLYDIARLSNQFVGPIRRVRLTLKNFLETEHYEPIRLRKGDYWQELACELNAAVEQASRPPQPSKAAAPTRAAAAASQIGSSPTQSQAAPAWTPATPAGIVADFGDAGTFAATSAR